MKKLILLTLLTTTLLGITSQTHFHAEETKAHNCTLCNISAGITLEKAPENINKLIPIFTTTIQTNPKLTLTKKTTPSTKSQRAPPQLSLI